MCSITSDATVTCFTAADPAEGAQVSEHNFLCNYFDDPNECSWSKGDFEGGGSSQSIWDLCVCVLERE